MAPSSQYCSGITARDTATKPSATSKLMAQCERSKIANSEFSAMRSFMRVLSGVRVVPVPRQWW